MMSAERVVLVCGATGRQGGAVARRLLGEGWRVRALTRHPEGAAARGLRESRADVVGGDLDDAGSLRRALDGVEGVFGVTEFWEHGFRAEVRQGKKLVDAARSVGVRHFVFSSVGGTNRSSGHYKVGPSLVAQFRWNNRSDTCGWDADLGALRNLHPI